MRLIDFTDCHLHTCKHTPCWTRNPELWLAHEPLGRICGCCYQNIIIISTALWRFDLSESTLAQRRFLLEKISSAEFPGLQEFVTGQLYLNECCKGIWLSYTWSYLENVLETHALRAILKKACEKSTQEGCWHTWWVILFWYMLGEPLLADTNMVAGHPDQSIQVILRDEHVWAKIINHGGLPARSPSDGLNLGGLGF